MTTLEKLERPLSQAALWSGHAAHFKSNYKLVSFLLELSEPCYILKNFKKEAR